MTEIRFTDLNLSDELLAALQKMGYEHPTPVQEKGIPIATSGADMMVQSQTGTGKTAAFGIPVIERLEVSKGIKALILCPTRELAKQVADEMTALGDVKGLRTAAVYGGASLSKQTAEMRFAHIVAGTPGRILDHLTRGNVDFGTVECLVLDEADEMLSMGFARELEQIMKHVPKNRQTLLFSATIPPDIKRYGKRYMKNPEFLSLIEENVAADQVRHHYYMVSGVGRTRDLARVIHYEEPETAIIFANTRKDTEAVARYLQKKGFSAEFLNSDLPQKERERVMELTKNKSLRFLVATDIAARGIDITQLSHVINYTLPESPEVYIHRTGRTGRAGAEGTAISLIGPREIGVFYYLKRLYNVALIEREIPTQAEIEMYRQEKEFDTLLSQLRTSIHPSELEKDTEKLAALILEREESQELVQILLHHFSHQGDRPVAKANVGGLLKDVPRPDRLAPGARQQSLQGVAERVAVMRAEFRGLPGDASPKNEVSPDDNQTTKQSTATAETPPQSKGENAEPDERVTSKKTDKSRAVAPRATPKAEQNSDVSADKEDADARQTSREKSESKPALSRTKKTKSSSKKAAQTDATGSSNNEADESDALPEREAIPDDMVRIFCNLGRRDGLSTEKIRDTISELAGLLPDDLARISIRSRHSFLLVNEEYAEDLIQAVNGERYGQRSIRVEIAR